jgi:AraC-like DNA-binding protein
LNETDAWDTPGVDLRPGYREFVAPAPLREAVACLWVRVPPPGGSPAARVLPDACVDIVWRAGHGAVLAGPDTGPAEAAAEGGDVLVGARFVPGAGGAALGLPLEALRDARVPLTELRPALDRELPGDLEPGEALRRVGALAGRLVTAAPPDRAVREAARRLEDPHARVERLAGDLGLSERQLRRRCAAGVGYGPKALHRVLRFRRFLARADEQGEAAALAELAFEVGYADQAHLTRECTRLSGLPPGALMRSRRG